jgi:hypothetical protein
MNCSDDLTSTGLTTVKFEIDSQLTSIDDLAFMCESLTEIQIPSGVQDVFDGCTSLPSITIKRPYKY